MNCPKCGLAVLSGSSFCNHCGAPLNEQGKSVGSALAPQVGPPAATDASVTTAMGAADEKTVWDEYPSLRTAWPRLLAVAAVYVIVLVAVHFFMPADARPMWQGRDAIVWGLTLGVALVIALMLLKSLIRLRSIKYRLTNQRIFITHGIFNKRTDEVELEKYKDVFVNQDFLDKIVGCGDIQIITGDVTNPTINVSDVSDPMGKKESIRSAARERQARLGLRLQQEM